MTIIAQDPEVKANGGILRASIRVPHEALAPGPCGYRVSVIDYDGSADARMTPLEIPPQVEDSFLKASDSRLLMDPTFHQQNVYAIVMRVLGRFEQALGRRVSWSFGGHQLKVVPHAFHEANAFYSPEDGALYFGYFQPSNTKTVFSCLSHDVVAHETTHALLDGLRPRYTDPSSPDQAAFHEGFSDIVSMLSVFSLPEVVSALIQENGLGGKNGRVPASRLTTTSLAENSLFRLAEEMGSELSKVRGDALRKSATLNPRKGILKEPEFEEPHRRGEVLAAAVLQAMISIWSARVAGLAKDERGTLDVVRVVEEGAAIADRLLTAAIRALDYCPPVHLLFGDYLSALLTADYEIHPGDQIYKMREHLRRYFSRFGIAPTSKGQAAEPGLWCAPEVESLTRDATAPPLVYDRTHFEPMQRDPDEIFRFIWENRDALGLTNGAFTRVLSVRPCIRVGEDGFMLRETVAEYTQTLNLAPKELKSRGINDPGVNLIPRDQELTIHGGGVLIFDEFGRLKFHVHNRLLGSLQSERIKHLAGEGFFLGRRAKRKPPARLGAFAAMHFGRSEMALPESNEFSEEAHDHDLTHDHETGSTHHP